VGENQQNEKGNDMKAIELYPSCNEYGYFSSPYEYQPIVDSFGTVLIQVDDNDYQGDSRVIYEKDGKYGYLNFGWGSCSGCDALQACDSYDDIESLISELENDIKWFDSLDDLKAYFTSKDWELDYSWHSDETKEFVKQVLEYNA
jgi:hypothetical protein